jgi:membrane protein YqaA with SNARE-associated domain
MVVDILVFLVRNFSYLGLFFTGVIATSTIIIPFPIDIAVFFTPLFGMHPLLSGIAIGTGAAVGELTGYYIGLGGSTMKRVKKSKLTEFFSKFFKNAGFVTVLVTSFIPFPFDIIGILAGISKYDLKKFLVATAIGKTLKALLIVYAGYFVLPYVGFFLKL